MILLIDNYDSFVYNLYQFIAEIEPDVKVVRNDEITSEEILKMNPDKIVISPGPGKPSEAADVVLMDDDPLKIVKAIKISKKCIRIVYQNIIFALTIKAICLILGAIGIANMWVAIFADVGVMVIAVLNAIRALYVKNL